MTERPVGTEILSLKPTVHLVVQIRAEGAVWVKPNNAIQRELAFHELLALEELDRNEWCDSEKLARYIADKTGVKPGKVLGFIKIAVQTNRLQAAGQKAPARSFEKFSCETELPTFNANDMLALRLPIPALLYQGYFYILSHQGEQIAKMEAGEFWLLSQLARPTTPAALSAAPDVDIDDLRAPSTNSLAHLALPNGESVPAGRFQEILGVMSAAGLMQRLEGSQIEEQETNRLTGRGEISKEIFAHQFERQEALNQQHELETGARRMRVIPVYDAEGVPTALGMIFAYAKAFKDGALEASFDFRLDWVWDETRLKHYTAMPAIYLFSNYLWSHENNLEISRRIKELSPGSITIHGGPDTPKYEEDARRYFENYDHVDIIVRGEGEVSAAEILEKLSCSSGDAALDLSTLKEVTGITYRHGEEIYRTPDRPRIKDLDSIPSPFLTGLFDAYKGVPRLHVTLETNRGCPYGCTFCDWGSATSSKIRKFDLERVLGELQWCSDARVQSIALGDANFGVFERDIAVAEKVASLKLANGCPETFNTSYAKNSTKYLQKIVRVMAEAGILAQGVLSLQTMDAGTLNVIKRSNIKVEQYNALANEMRKSNLQLTVELMMGLPGSTLESTVDDLQQCIDRDIPARVNNTTMLINSPMNSPDYREEHALETNTDVGPGKIAILVSSRSYTREEYRMMLALRRLYMFFDNFGVLRVCSRFVRHRTGMLEMDFYKQLLALSGRPGGSKWPILETLVHVGPDLMAPPYSWALVMEELRGFLVADLGMADDSALRAILQAQHAVQPAHGRQFPVSIALEHDVAAWHNQMLAAKEAGHLDNWPDVVPDLASFGPSCLQVDDPHRSVTRLLGCDIEMNAYGVNWDFDSDIGRARVAQNFTPAWEEEGVQII